VNGGSAGASPSHRYARRKVWNAREGEALQTLEHDRWKGGALRSRVREGCEASARPVDRRSGEDQ
jgi:hypothetical protein